MRRLLNALLVGLVLFVCTGLAVAGLARVWHAAARMGCYNNLKMIGIWLDTAYDASDSYPTASIPGEPRPYVPGQELGRRLPPEKRFSWLVTLRDLEQEPPLTLDRSKPWDDELNVEPGYRYEADDGTLVEKLVGEPPNLRCPRNPSRAGPRSPGLTHYVGVAGLGVGAADSPEGDPGVGIFGHDRRTRREDLKDGAATTMTVIETTSRNGPWTAGGHPTARGLDPAGGPYLGEGGQFGSNHRGGDLLALRRCLATNALFADGSVRFLSASIDPRVFEALATIAGREQVGGIGE